MRPRHCGGQPDGRDWRLAACSFQRAVSSVQFPACSFQRAACSSPDERPYCRPTVAGLPPNTLRPRTQFSSRYFIYCRIRQPASTWRPNSRSQCPGHTLPARGHVHHGLACSTTAGSCLALVGLWDHFGRGDAGVLWHLRATPQPKAADFDSQPRQKCQRNDRSQRQRQVSRLGEVMPPGLPCPRFTVPVPLVQDRPTQVPQFRLHRHWVSTRSNCHVFCQPHGVLRRGSILCLETAR